MNIVVKRPIELQPKNPVATFVNDYGETEIIHRKKGKRLSVFRGGNTPALRMNRAAAILIGQNIRQRRLAAGLSMRQLSIRAGLHNVSPKQYIHALETAMRSEGMRFGTLYAIAYALGCEPRELLPPMESVMELAGVGPGQVSALAVGGDA